ncbi:hypothetical protein O1V64_23280 [Rouxiella badensis]|nr:hypothetical protein O1V64_23280 [Rouxiella badensis]
MRGGGWAILQGKGWTSFGIATATARLVDAVLSDAQSVYPVAAWDDAKQVYIGQPAIIGKGGIVKRLHPKLTTAENAAYESSARVILDAFNR